MRLRQWILLLLVWSSLLPVVVNASSTFTIGSKTFTESIILGEIIRSVADANRVNSEHKAQLGGTNILWNALLRGEIDAYAEYSGTLTNGILVKQKIVDIAALREFLLTKGIRMTSPLGFNNTYAIGVSSDLAQKHQLSRISDLSTHPEFVFGFTNEFMDRADGWPGLRTHYNLPQREVTGLDHDLAYRALQSNAIQVTDLYATDAEIEYYKLRVLVDDKKYFPAYHAVILYRDDVASRFPAVVTGIENLASNINATTMVAMNADVKLHGKSETEVAANFVNNTFGLNASFEAESAWQRFLRNTKEHIFLVMISLVAAIIVAIPLGVIAATQPKLELLILGTASIFQTIPALALFVFMIPLLGIGGPPALLALFLYSLLPIVRNTYAGLHDIPVSIKESAVVLGLSSMARLRIVELPLATRSILAGIKTSAVINVGTATLGAIIGAGGYGQAILTGIRLDSTSLILQGAIPAAVLALLVQGGFEFAERRLLLNRLK